MCTKEHVLGKKMFTNGINVAQSQNDIPSSENILILDVK